MSSSSNDKRRIAHSFGKAATNYDDQAGLQQAIACELASLCKHPNPRYALDIGSGTGYGAFLLKGMYPQAEVVALDVSYPMVKQVSLASHSRKNRITPLNADAEAMPFAAESFDIIFSCSSFQWLRQLKKVLEDCFRILTFGGRIFFSSFGENTLHELASSWKTIDGHMHTLEFLPPYFLKQYLRDCGYRMDIFRRQTHVCYFPSVHDLLEMLKAIGANYYPQNRNRGITTPGTFRSMEMVYTNRYASATLIPATFDILYFVASKTQ